MFRETLAHRPFPIRVSIPGSGSPSNGSEVLVPGYAVYEPINDYLTALEAA